MAIQQDTPRRQASGATSDRTTADELIAALPGLHRTIAKALRLRGIYGEDANDIRQDSFLVVIEKIRADGLRNPGLLEGYLYKTAWNLATRQWRRRRRAIARRWQPDVHHWMDEDDQFENVTSRADRPAEDFEHVVSDAVPVGTPERHAELQEQSMRVQGVLERLLPRDSEALRRTYLNEEPRRLCADALGLGEKQLNTVIWRAKSRFARLAPELRP